MVDGGVILGAVKQWSELDIDWWRSVNSEIAARDIDLAPDPDSGFYRKLVALQTARFMGYATASEDYYDVVSEETEATTHRYAKELFVSAGSGSEPDPSWLATWDGLEDDVQGVLCLKTMPSAVVMEVLTGTTDASRAWQELWYVLLSFIEDSLGSIGIELLECLVDECLVDIAMLNAGEWPDRYAAAAGRGSDLWEDVRAEPCFKLSKNERKQQRSVSSAAFVPKFDDVTSGKPIHLTTHVYTRRRHIYSPTPIQLVSSSESFFDNPVDELPSWQLTGTNVEWRNLDPEVPAVLPHTLGDKRGVRELSITGKLDHLPDGIGDLRFLERFVLTDSGLTSVPDSIGQLEFLAELDLSNNQLTELPETFGQLTTLVKLHVAGNQLTHLPASLSQLPNLKELVVVGNPLPTEFLKLAREGSIAEAQAWLYENG